MAQSVIGSIYVNLGLSTAQFAQELQGVRARLAGIGQGMQKVGAAMSVGVGAAVAGVSLAMRGVLNDADEMAKAAQKFGVPIEELSRLRHAADLSGVSFEGLGTGMRRLSQNMNDAAKGIGESKEAFEQLGISVTDADGSLKSSTAVLNEIAERFAAMPDGAEKTALAMDLMGRSGADLIPLLNAGAQGLQSMKDEADALGIVITGETAKAAEQFNDNLTRLNRVFDGLKTVVAAELAPVLADLSDWFAENGPRIVSALRDLVGWFRSLSPETQRLAGILAAVAAAAGPVLVGLGTLAIVVSALSAPVLAVVGAVAGLAAALAYFGTDAETAGAKLQALGQAIAAWAVEQAQNLFVVDEDWKAFWAAVGEGVDNFIDWMVLLPANVRGMAENVRVALIELAANIVAVFTELPGNLAQVGRDTMAGLARGIEEGFRSLVRPALDSAVQQMVDEPKGWLDIHSPSGVFREIGEQTMAGLALGLQAGAPSAGAGIRQMVDDGLAEMGRLQAEMPPQARIAAEGVGHEFSGVLDPLKQALRGGELSFQSFGDVLVGIGERLRDRLIDEAFRPIEDAIAGLFTGGKGGGGLFSSLVSIFGGLFGGSALSIAGGGASAFSGVYAKGGHIPSGRWGIAGEAGPEIIRGPARVFSNADSHAMLGGAGMTVNVHNNAGAEVGVQQRQTPSGPTLDIIIDQKMAQARARGGSAFNQASAAADALVTR